MELDESCHKCNGNLQDANDYVVALNRSWHSGCFTCTICHAELRFTFYAHKGLPYCTMDYFTRFGSTCKKCRQCITGPMMSAGREQFHPECFFCDECLMPVGEGDAFALINRTKLVCHLCFNQQKASLSSRILTRINLPPGTFDCQITAMTNTKKKKKRFLHIFRKPPPSLNSLDNANIMGIEEGDQIIEVNGTPVRGQTTEQVMALVREHSHEGVELVIERRNRNLVEMQPKASIRRSKANQARLSDSRQKQRPPSQTSLSSVNESLPSSPVSLCEGQAVKSDISRRGRSLKIRAGAEVCSMEKSLEVSNVTRRGLVRNTSCPAGVATSPSSSLTGGEAFSDFDLDCSDDEIPGEDDEKEICSQTDTRDASALVVTQVRRCTIRGRTSTLPSRMRLLTDPMSIINSALYRGESISGPVLPSSRSVFRPHDLEFGEVLGEGFFGRAVKVTNKANGEVMVMKELVKCTTEARKTFLQEVQMMKALDHINVMPLLGIMYREHNLCIITEFIGGGTLSERIMDKSKELPDQLKISYACDIAAGMAYLHAHKIIHRDLTSNNCMIRVDESVVVGDFGLAKVLASTDPRSCTVVGSAYWMAPEMMAGKGYDFRADIFSFGIITCELIGRISADPDEMPRTMEFGLDDKAFRRDFLGDFSTNVFDVPSVCCSLDPEFRPKFCTIEAYLKAYLTAIDSGVPFVQTFRSFVKVFEGR